uniref:Uncharacterized protein n=1 Tax=Rhizophora mucronata TaxID=61149 RepID=A0A2P2P4J3_RHIMU
MTAIYDGFVSLPGFINCLNFCLQSIHLTKRIDC